MEHTNAMEIKVRRLHKLDSNSAVKAFADIVVNDCLLIKSLRVVNGRDGIFVSMPQEKAKDDKWYDSVRCLDEQLRQEITKAVLGAYSENA